MKADCKIIALLALLITTAPFAVAQDGDGKERTAGNKSAAPASGRDGKKKTSAEQKKAASKTSDKTAGKAAENNSAKSSASRNNRTTSRPTVNRLPAADVESALRFARKHHPELARLLEKLRGKSDLEFHRGIREVHNAAVRLERYRDKQPARFEAGLRDWKLDSEIRLLSAKWIVSGDSKLEQRIQQLLRQRMESRIETMKSERDRLAARLEQLDQQINMDTAELEAALVAEWDRLSRRAAASSKAKRPERKSPMKKTDKDK